MAYQGTRKPAAQIARELGVDALIEGSVNRRRRRPKEAPALYLTAQAPRFEQGIVEPFGGLPLPNNFNEDFDGWYDLWVSVGKPPNTTCDTTSPIPPLNILPPDGWCSNPRPVDIFSDVQIDWGMTIYQVSSGALVFNAATNQWSWGLDDYSTGLNTGDGANNGPRSAFSVGTRSSTRGWLAVALRRLNRSRATCSTSLSIIETAVSTPLDRTYRAGCDRFSGAQTEGVSTLPALLAKG